MPADHTLQDRLCEALEALRTAREALIPAAGPLQRANALAKADAVLNRERDRFLVGGNNGQWR